jgi:arylformamidase
MKVWDITRVMEDGMPIYPGDPSFHREILPGVGVTIAALSMGSHCGTHLDAPAHLLPEGTTIDRIDPERFLCSAHVAAVPSPGGITREMIEQIGFQRGEALLFKSPVHDGVPVFLLPAAAEHLVDRGVGLVGTDMMSVDPPDAPGLPVHRQLLKAGVLILEGLDLRGVSSGCYRLIALPLLIRGGDGAPVRALLTAEKEV